jgi:hypothetical protein
MRIPASSNASTSGRGDYKNGFSPAVLPVELVGISEEKHYRSNPPVY